MKPKPVAMMLLFTIDHQVIAEIIYSSRAIDLYSKCSRTYHRKGSIKLGFNRQWS